MQADLFCYSNRHKSAIYLRFSIALRECTLKSSKRWTKFWEKKNSSWQDKREVERFNEGFDDSKTQNAKFTTNGNKLH